MQQHAEYVFVIRHAQNQRFIGLCGLHRLHQADAEVGIWIQENQHGHRYGLEAVQTIVHFAFEQLKRSRLRYPVAEENWASRKIAESLGGTVAETYQHAKYKACLYYLYLNV